MEFAVNYAMETGLFLSPVNFADDTLFLGVAFWICILLGFGIQLPIMLKCRSAAAKLIFPAILAVILFVFEILVHSVNGWDMLLWLILWYWAFTALSGAVIASIAAAVAKKLGKK